MNPDETYPMTEPTPTLGQILSSLTSLHAKVDALALQHAGDRGLIALGVVSPTFREDTAKDDEGWIEWSANRRNPPRGGNVLIRCRNGHEGEYSADHVNWVGDPAGEWEILGYKVVSPAQEQA